MGTPKDPEPFSPLLFRLYASDLSAAIYELSQENQMNIRLRELAESREKLHHVTELPVRPTITPTEKPRMSSITGLDGGLIQAALDRAKQRLVAKATEGVAKIEGAAIAGEAKIDGVASNLAAKIEKEIEDQVSQFVTVTNGGPV